MFNFPEAFKSSQKPKKLIESHEQASVVVVLCFP